MSDALASGAPTPRRTLLLRLARFRLIPEGVTEFHPPGRPDLTFVTAGSPIALTAFWYGLDGHRTRAPERTQVAVWERLCAGASSIVEVGAHIGTLTVPGARAAPHARYRAIEAHPGTADVLQRNLTANGLGHVVVEQVAAVRDSTQDSVTLVHPDEDPYELSASALVPSGRVVAGRELRVPARAIEEIVEDADLMKLDVEGLEGELLPPLRGWILGRRPALMIEVLDYTPGLKGLVGDLCTEARYTIDLIVSSGLHRLRPDELLSTDLGVELGSNDLLLLPEETASPL